MKKILFITHEASRTGAPILLLNFLKWFKENNNSFEVSLLSMKNGSLSQEFIEHVDFLYEIPKTTNKKNSILKKIKNRITSKLNTLNEKELLISSISNIKWDLVFSNTIVNGKVLDSLNLKNIPVISYVHELDYSINFHLKRGTAQGTFKNTNYFLCGSKLVLDNLLKNYNIYQENSKVVYSFQEFSLKTKNILISKEIRKEFKIPEDSLVIGMMGSFTWRKGIDFFIETAKKMNRDDIYFLWVGADNDKLINQIYYDLRNMEIELKLVLIPSSSDYSRYFNTIDIFFLSSREDPYPMVMVEASSYGIPIICFENAGGTQEFIDSKTGHVVPYGDIESVSNAIRIYYNSRKLLSLNSMHIKELSRQKHDVLINAKEIFNVIRELI